MNNFVWLIIAIAAGAMLPIQAGLNTRLAKEIESPVYASLVSFIVGAVALLTYVIVMRQSVSWIGFKSAPLVAWTGGVLGAFYVTAIILAFPRLGPAVTVGLVVAGQMVFSVLLDHANILVAHPTPLNLYRVLGIGLIVAGVILIRKF